MVNKAHLPLAKNATRKLRTLRHPGVIKVLDTFETDVNIYIVTERVTPLSWQVKRRSLSEETAKWGLHTVASTLKFVNDDASSVHGCVRVSSVYTGESGEWKLGGFDILSSMKDDDAVIYTYGTLLPDSARYCPPEVAKSGWEIIKRHPVSAVDAYSYGILIYETFNGSFMGGDQAGQTKNVPSSMHQSYKRLLNPNPKLRLSTGHFLELGKKDGGFFETPLIRLTEGVESLGLKSEAERDDFVGELDGISDDFPEDFFKMKVLPELLKSVEFGGGGPKVFSAIMKIGIKLSDDEYESKLLPVINRLFASPDRATRVCLLDNLPLMIDRMPQKFVNDKMFPNLVTGFADTAPVIREQTVKSVLTIIPKLSDRIINGELLKQLAKTSNDEQPGIRTNTTICLGKIAKNLGASTRSKVLIAAFSRSLRDPFVHARNAALMALGATMDFFSDEDCATKILPSLCMSLIDREKLIRDQANKTFDLYVLRVRKYSSTLGDTALAPPNSVDAGNNPHITRMGTQNDTSWAGWAISSFTNKMTTAKGEMQSNINGMRPARPEESRSSSLPPSRLTLASAPTVQKGQGRSSTPSAKHETEEQPTGGAEVDTSDVYDSWGMMDEEDDAFFDAPSRAIQNPGPVPSTSNPFEDQGEPDFAGWLAAQSQAKSKKPLPKGLTKMSKETGMRPLAAARSTTTGSVGSGVGAQKLAHTTVKPKVTSITKKFNTAPRTDEAEDGWGDAWD